MRQLQSPWSDDAHNNFFVAIGQAIDTFLIKEDVHLSDATDVIFNMHLDRNRPTISDPTTWSFRGERYYILFKDFGERLKADLEPRLPDLLRRFGPTQETLIPRRDVTTRCFRKDWTEGSRYTVALVPINRAPDRALQLLPE